MKNSRTHWAAKICLIGIFTLMSLGCPAPLAAAINLVDAAGQHLTLDRQPERIVLVGTAPFVPLHMLYMFEETKQRLKGFEAKTKQKDEFLNLIDPNFSSKITLATNPGPESVAALTPDLVISKGTQTTPLGRSLKVLGIPVLYVGAETPDMFLRDIKNLGMVLGTPRRADQIVDYYGRKLALIQRQVGGLGPGERPRVLVLEYSNRGNKLTLKVPAPSWTQTQQATLSGGTPVWLDTLKGTNGWQLTGFEQIAAWNPDKIFLVVWYRLQGPEVIRTLYKDPKWRHLKALKQNNLYLFPKDIFGWDTPSPRWILGALWMAKVSFPDKFSSGQLRMVPTIIEFFKLLYNLKEPFVRRHIITDIYLYGLENEE